MEMSQTSTLHMSNLTQFDAVVDQLESGALYAMRSSTIADSAIRFSDRPLSGAPANLSLEEVASQVEVYNEILLTAATSVVGMSADAIIEDKASDPSAEI